MLKALKNLLQAFAIAEQPRNASNNTVYGKWLVYQPKVFTRAADTAFCIGVNAPHVCHPDALHAKYAWEIFHFARSKKDCGFSLNQRIT